MKHWENVGTPKSLVEAIKDGICQAHGPESPEQIRLHVKDFIAQKFTVAVHRAESEAESKRLLDLFSLITESLEK